MDERRYAHLLDLIYGAAADPDLWVAVLETMADTLGGNSAWLSQLSVADGSGSGLLARIDPVMPVRYIEYFGHLNPFANIPCPESYLSRWTPTIQTDTDWYMKDDLVKTEYYNDFMRPQQVHSVLMIDLAVQGLETVTVNINRAEHQGPFDEEAQAAAAALHSHLIRAFRLGQVFTAPKALGDAALAALDHSPHGLFIFDGAGRLRHVNRAGERIVARRLGLRLIGRRLVGPNPDLTRKLEGLILAAASPDPTIRAGGSLALPSIDGAAPMSISVAPLVDGRRPMFGSGPSVLVCVTDLESEIDVSERLMRDLFALTTAEARVARLLLRGDKPRQVAEASGVGLSTVRSQLTAIFEKTGVADQAELSRLLMRVNGIEDG